MANFAVASSQETIDRANKVFEAYGREGEKKEEILIRILDLAESQAVRGTHPEQVPAMDALDQTLANVRRQFEGLIGGQDERIKGLMDQLQAAKDEAAKTKAACQEAQEAAEARASEAVANCQAELDKALEQIRLAVEQRDQALAVRASAISEAKAARDLAEAKEAAAAMLLSQMQAMQADMEAYKALQIEYKSLEASCRDKDYTITTLTADMDRLKAEHEAALQALADRFEKDLSRAAKEAKRDQELAVEKAVNAKAAEMQAALREADKVNAKLEAKIELLEARLAGK